MKLFREVQEVASDLMGLAASVLILIFFLKYVVGPVVPVICVILAAICTIATFGSFFTALLSVGGIAFYISSWPAESIWGTAPGFALFWVGVAFWVYAIYGSRQHHNYTLQVRGN